MKQLFENWRNHVNESPIITEISFDDAKKRLESKALLKWIKGMAFDEEMRVMTLNPEQIDSTLLTPTRPSPTLSVLDLES